MILKCTDFKPEEYFRDPPLLKKRRGNPGGKTRKYIGITTAFDIETTLLDCNQSIMYIWQWQFGEDVTVIGRTWEEFLDLQARIRKALPKDRWLVVYVHNLSYEFQYLKGVYTFTPDDVFAIDSRKLLKCDMWNCFEFRCSYRLSNMSLKQFTENMHVKHQKLSGDDFDYSRNRYPWTELTDDEIAYCVNDVWGLVEAVNALMARDGDTLSTIPLTSTGYVRRNAKRAMRSISYHHNFVYSITPDIELYGALREAFRGGNTHANRYFTGEIISNVHSADRSSSYPAVMCNCEYPMSKFVPILESDLNEDYIIRCMTIRHKALLLRIGFENVKLRDPFWGCPYISSSNCRKLRKANYTFDNGRILEAEYLEMTITDVDLKIILSEYSGTLYILQGWYASYKKLPDPLISEVISYYQDKTALKGVEGKELLYDKIKALLNSWYGMMVQDPVKFKQIFKQVGDFDTDEKLLKEKAVKEAWSIEMLEKAIKDKQEEILEENNKHAFLAYQWGVWVTAHARAALEAGIRLVQETPGAHFIYCDTDSVKYIGEVDWTEYNQARITECLESGSFATDPAGKVHYMGVFESEDNPETGFAYAYFKTLGAKKYAFQKTEGGPTHCTIAGVDKKKGGPELDRAGGISKFEDGFLFLDAGGTQALYNDTPKIDHLEIDGHELKITSNVCILPSTYRVGITGEYERIIKYAKNYLYNPYVV